MKRLDEDDTEQYLKITIAGPSGAGKSWLGATAPDPLVLVFERQAVASIRAACATRNKPLPMMLLMDSIADCGNVLRAFHGNRAEPFVVRDARTKEAIAELPQWPKSLVVDSISDACDLMRTELLREAPPKKNDEGIADESYAHRRKYEDRCIQLIKSFRNVPAHVIFLCLLEDKPVYVKRREVGRQYIYKLPTKGLQPTLMAASNICGMIYRRLLKSDTGEIQVKVGVVLQASGETYPTKGLPPLRPREPADVGQWCDRVLGTWQGSVPSSPPEPEDMDPIETLEAAENALSQDNSKNNKTAPTSKKRRLSGPAATAE